MNKLKLATIINTKTSWSKSKKYKEGKAYRVCTIDLLTFSEDEIEIKRLGYKTKDGKMKSVVLEWFIEFR